MDELANPTGPRKEFINNHCGEFMQLIKVRCFPIGNYSICFSPNHLSLQHKIQIESCSVFFYDFGLISGFGSDESSQTDLFLAKLQLLDILEISFIHFDVMIELQSARNFELEQCTDWGIRNELMLMRNINIYRLDQEKVFLCTELKEVAAA